MLTRRHQNRRFNRLSYMANDGKAKAVLKKYLISRDHKVTSDTENYSWDLTTIADSG